MRFITSFNHLYLESSTILYTHTYERRISLGKSFGKRFLFLHFSTSASPAKNGQPDPVRPGWFRRKGSQRSRTGKYRTRTKHWTVRSLTSISVGTVYAGFTAPRSLAETNTLAHKIYTRNKKQASWKALLRILWRSFPPVQGKRLGADCVPHGCEGASLLRSLHIVAFVDDLSWCRNARKPSLDGEETTKGFFCVCILLCVWAFLNCSLWSFSVSLCPVFPPSITLDFRCCRFARVSGQKIAYSKPRCCVYECLFCCFCAPNLPLPKAVGFGCFYDDLKSLIISKLWYATFTAACNDMQGDELLWINWSIFGNKVILKAFRLNLSTHLC